MCYKTKKYHARLRKCAAKYTKDMCYETIKISCKTKEYKNDMWCKIHENVLQDQKNVLQDQKNVLQDYRKCAAESFWKTGVGFLLKLNPTANSLFSIELYF